MYIISVCRSGRRNWDGTGGTGAALKHYEVFIHLYYTEEHSSCFYMVKMTSLCLALPAVPL
jgi:hypothetical protein